MAHETGRIVVVGGGHNSLVTAFYIAKAGYQPLVLERREITGGVAVTEEIYPGFRCPALVHMAGPLSPQVMRDMQLESGGLQLIKPDLTTLALDPDERSLHIYADPQRTASALAAVSPRDAAKYLEFYAVFQRIGHALAPLLSMTPPDVDNLKMDDYFNLGKAGLKFRRLDKKDAYRLLRWGPMPIEDLAAEWFETELLRATVVGRGIFGCFSGPRSAGTSVGLLLQAALGGGPFFVRGGPGAVAQAMSSAATAAGAQIRTGASVTQIRVKNGRAAAVVLDSGEEIPAVAVVSGLDPQHTFLRLIDPSELEPGFLLKVRAYRAHGAVAKINLALSASPVFRGITDLPARIHIGPEIDYLERAFDAAKYGEFSTEPFMDVTIPSVIDSSLAPKGGHVMSIYAQYAPYRLKTGDWNGRRDELGDAVLKTLSTYAPNIRDLVVHRQVLAPLDLEAIYGLSGGHIFHGEHSLDQFLAFRPFLGWARYRTPIRGLYLCGAGTHPGGGVTGAPGANASREIIQDLKRKSGSD